MLRLTEESPESIAVYFGQQQLFSYVHSPATPQLESPRPYFHPLYTLGGDLVSLFRPHDHVWHRGLAWSLPNVTSPSASDANFWGGPTYLRDQGYVQLPNNGSMKHDEFLRLSADADSVAVAHRLHWTTEPGETWFREMRRFEVSVFPSAWVLTFATAMTNVSGHSLVIGSPGTEGRENAGYGGLFWRGPRSFSGGRVSAPGLQGTDDLMGVPSEWLAFTGTHDEHGRSSTLVFVDAEENRGHPVRWFVRSGIFACVCPAPFFDTTLTLKAEESLFLRYAMVIADGDTGVDGMPGLASLGREALSRLDIGAQLLG